MISGLGSPGQIVNGIGCWNFFDAFFCHRTLFQIAKSDPSP